MNITLDEAIGITESIERLDLRAHERGWHATLAASCPACLLTPATAPVEWLVAL